MNNLKQKKIDFFFCIIILEPIHYLNMTSTQIIMFKEEKLSNIILERIIYKKMYNRYKQRLQNMYYMEKQLYKLHVIVE